MAAVSNQVVEAIRLLGRWSKLEQRHLPFGGGCSCGAGMVSIRVSELERDLLDFLKAKHSALPSTASLRELLRALAQPSAPKVPGFFKDLERSLESFEELHR